MGLSTLVQNWPTPSATPYVQNKTDSPGAQHRPSLWIHARRNWPTPTTSLQGPGTQGREGGINIRTAAALWPTPTARDWRSGWNAENQATRNTPGLSDLAITFALDRTLISGNPFLYSSKSLNPQFEEVGLMGLPRGWSNPICSTLTAYEHWVTRYVHYRQTLLGTISGRGSWVDTVEPTNIPIT